MVELMFNKELSDITFDVEALDEWKQLAEELGMTKQLELTKGYNSPIPYPYMNQVMERVYKTLCPNSVPFKEYKNTTIPLEIMQQIAFSVKECHFNEIMIWADDKAPDPLVVGETCEWYNNAKNEKGDRIYFQSEEECKSHPDNNRKAYPTNVKRYIIARWGDELKSFAELKALALERLINSTSISLQREIKEKTEKLNSIKENCAAYLDGQISLYQIN